MKFILNLILIVTMVSISSSAFSQLRHHGDSEFNQLNLYVKYINESNNVLGLVTNAMQNDAAKKLLSENFETSLYHMPALTIQDRQTCEFIDAVIKSNAKHFSSEAFENLGIKLKALRKAEAEFNSYIAPLSVHFSSFDKIDLDLVDQHYSTIYKRQQDIQALLKEEAKSYGNNPIVEPILNIYHSFTELLDLENQDQKKEMISSLNSQIEDFNFEPLSEFNYSKELIVKAFDNINEAVNSLSESELNLDSRNEILIKYFNSISGIPELFNEALERYKNVNKEVKFIKCINLPTQVN